MTIKKAYSYGAEYLLKNNIENSDFEAKELLCSILGFGNTDFLLNGANAISDEAFVYYTDLLERRVQGEPLQYILGKWSFLDCDFFVGEGVLIPRPETEQLAQMCIDRIKSNNLKVVYDLCSGTGCIGISIAKACRNTKVYLFEKYPVAAEYLKKNIALNDVKNAECVVLDIFEGLQKEIDLPELIVSNPPYIPVGLLHGLQKEVQREPVTALDGGVDGLDFYRAISEKWLSPLKGNLPACLVECGEEQANQISGMFSLFGETKIQKDIFGVERFIELKK